MEAHLARDLGVRLETRPDGRAREIVGVPQAALDLFSQRRRAVTEKTEELLAAHAARFGREASPAERFRIAQEATLATRRGKDHAAEGLDERLDRWEAETRAAIRFGLTQVAHLALQAGAAGGPAARWDARDVVDRALARVGESKATWSRSDMTRAVSDVLPGHLGMAPERVGSLLEGLTDIALAEAVVTRQAESAEGLAAAFRLRDGRSAYQEPGAERYATPGQMGAEYALADAGIARGAVALDRAAAVAVVDRFAANGVELGQDQRAAVIGVLSSGARVEVLAAAAGAGKSFVVGTINEAWREHGHRLLGLTPSQVAAQVLADEGVEALNLARWRGAQQRLDEGRPMADDEQYRIQQGDLLVVDEAGMAATQDLAEVVARADRAGAKVLLVGDPRQLAAVGPGGALSDVGQRAGMYELTEVRRFRAEWEGPASLQLRNADPEALDAYDRHGRIVPAGTPEHAALEAGRAWLADTVAGRESLLLVGDNETAAQVASGLRAELVRLGRVQAEGLLLGRDGTTAGVGDRVQARRNGWDLLGHEGNARAPINRETYRVTETHPDGSMTVQDSSGVPIRLSADYVAADVSLAYASTVHAAQGRTVDTCHTVVGGGSDAAAVYVGLTRGRDANTAWLVTRATASDAPVGSAQDVKERPARAVLAEVLERAELDRGAVAEQHHHRERDASTLTNVDRLADGIAAANAGRTSGLLDRLVIDGVLSPQDRAGLASDRAMGAVERLLRSAEVAGRDPQQVLRDALDGSPLDGARAPAQVLHARIRDSLDAPTGGTIDTYRDLIPAGVSGDMRTQLERFADAADTRRHELGARTAENPPRWALDTLGPVPADPLERIDWERRAGWGAAYRENAGVDDDERPLGPAPAPGLSEKRAVWWTAHERLGLPDIAPAEDAMTDGQLRTRVAAYEREEAWAPRWVADELAATAQEAAAEKVNADLWAARAQAAADEELADEANQARDRAAELEQRQQQLEEIDRARGRWYEHTAETRNVADRAKAALEARGVDVEDPGGKVTADEWLDAHQAEQVEAEKTLEVTAGDVDEVAETRDEVEFDVDEAQAETQVPDIRDTAERDPSQDIDPAREVPDEDSTAAAVARAREAIREMQARDEDDAARADEQPPPAAVETDDDADADVMDEVMA
jgi:hypothetical protein